MSTPQNFEEFLTVDFLKIFLQITNKEKDDILFQCAFSANENVHNAIFSYIDTPLAEGSIYWSRCHDIALSYAVSLFAKIQELFEKADNFKKQYNLDLFGDNKTNSGLIGELKATRTNRTETTLASFDPRRRKVILPSQLDLAATEQFT